MFQVITERCGGSFAKDGSHPYQKQHYLNVVNGFEKIKDCIFDCKNFEELNPINSVIYCDPPYLDSKKQYYDCDFNYDKFYNWCEKMSKNNKIFISETQMPDNFKIIWQKEYTRTLSHNTKGIQTIEKLYTI